MKKSKKNIKIFIAGHRGMVGSSLLDYLKKKNLVNYYMPLDLN